MERKTKIWLAAGGGCAALLAVLLIGLAGAGLWWYRHRVAPPVPPAAAADTAPVAPDPRAVLQQIGATVPDYTMMTMDQREACAGVFAQALAAQDAGRLAPAEFDQLLDAWAALLADNAVTEEEVAELQRLVAEAAGN